MPSSTPRPQFDYDEVGDDSLTSVLALLESHRYSRWRAEGWAAIDIPPDQTRFATGNGEASVWDITTEERLLGILEHDT